MICFYSDNRSKEMMRALTMNFRAGRLAPSYLYPKR